MANILMCMFMFLLLGDTMPIKNAHNTQMFSSWMILYVCVCVNVWHLFACMKTCNGACMKICAGRPGIVCDCEGFDVAS